MYIPLLLLSLYEDNVIFQNKFMMLKHVPEVLYIPEYLHVGSKFLYTSKVDK